MTDGRALDGALAIVTGAQGNLGPLWVRTLRDAGATVIGIDVQEGEGVEVADVTDRAALDDVARRIDERHGTPQILVNNAGIDAPPSQPARTYRPEDVPWSDFARTVEVNLGGVFQTTQVFGSRMAAAGRGSIVNIGSLYAGIAADPTFYSHMEADPPFLKPAAYGASKAGVVNLTRYFARLWGPQGVRVNALSPGGVRGGQDPEFVRKFTARVPLGRMAELEDLAAPLLFLAGDGSSYLTGHELRVDGGFTA